MRLKFVINFLKDPRIVALARSAIIVVVGVILENLLHLVDAVGSPPIP